MKTKAYLQEFNLALLHEELQTLPGYITEEKNDDLDSENPTKVAHYVIRQIPGGIALSIDDDLEFPNQLFMESHDPKQKSQWEKEKEEKAQRKADVLKKFNMTEEELKILLDS